MLSGSSLHTLTRKLFLRSFLLTKSGCWCCTFDSWSELKWTLWLPVGMIVPAPSAAEREPVTL